MATHPDAVQHFKIFQCSVRMLQEVIAKTVWTFSQDVRTWTCYGKNFSILERQLQLTVQTLGQAIRTPSSILIITLCSNIGL
jgi:hypothetical protein